MAVAMINYSIAYPGRFNHVGRICTNGLTVLLGLGLLSIVVYFNKYDVIYVLFVIIFTLN